MFPKIFNTTENYLMQSIYISTCTEVFKCTPLRVNSSRLLSTTIFLAFQQLLMADQVAVIPSLVRQFLVDPRLRRNLEHYRCRGHTDGTEVHNTIETTAESSTCATAATIAPWRTVEEPSGRRATSPTTLATTSGAISSRFAVPTRQFSSADSVSSRLRGLELQQLTRTSIGIGGSAW
jgi:hypothetical protein